MKLIEIIFKIFHKLYNIYIKVDIYAKLGYKPLNLKVHGKIYMMNKNVIFGDNVILYPNVTFWGNGKIVIGNNVKIGQNTMIYASEKGGVEIGDYTIIAGQNYIIDCNHGIKKECLIQNQDMVVKKICIGSDVWLGCDVSVVPGAIINEGCVIGAKSFVNSEILPYTVAVGNPAKIIKERC